MALLSFIPFVFLSFCYFTCSILAFTVSIILIIFGLGYIVSFFSCCSIFFFYSFIHKIKVTCLKMLPFIEKWLLFSYFPLSRGRGKHSFSICLIYFVLFLLFEGWAKTPYWKFSECFRIFLT